VAADHLLELVVGALNGMDVQVQFGALDGWAVNRSASRGSPATTRYGGPNRTPLSGGSQQALDQDWCCATVAPSSAVASTTSSAPRALK
jgi:hypothetical protein